MSASTDWSTRRGSGADGGKRITQSGAKSHALSWPARATTHVIHQIHLHVHDGVQVLQSEDVRRRLEGRAVGVPHVVGFLEEATAGTGLIAADILLVIV
jgi:hypothetical protein